MTPQFKFTITEPTYAPTGTEVEQPIGWKDASISLERHDTYHSLVEQFKGSFLWYGSARDLILQIEAGVSADAKPEILIEITFDGSTYETIFNGLLDLSQVEDFYKQGEGYKCQCPIIQKDIWVTFLNRKSTPVDLLSTTSLDGDSITPVAKITLPLPCQAIQKTYYGTISDPLVYNEPASGNYIQYDMNNQVISEILDKITLPVGIQTDASALFTFTEKGSYVFDIRVEASWVYYTLSGLIPSCVISGHTANASSKMDFWIYISGVGLSVMSATNTGTSTYWTYSGTHDMVVGAQVKIFGLMSSSINTDGNNIVIYGTNAGMTVETLTPGAGSPGDPCYVAGNEPVNISLSAPSGAGTPTYISIIANTVTDNTTTDSFLIEDAAENIARNYLGGSGRIYSDYFDTCGWDNAIAKGKSIRGYSFSEKAISLSFDDWWAGVSPILPIGLGYKSSTQLEIEALSDFYDPTPSIYLSNVPNLVRTYDQKYFNRSVNIGFEKWSAESDGGVDDPQTNHTYSSPLSSFGQDVKILSKFIAASLAIEQTRRNRKELGKDWRLDEDTLIIQVKSDGGGGYTPVTGADFSSVTNLKNSDTRYNIAHTPARMLYRWLSWLQGGLQSFVGSALKFTKGEGNFEMVSNTADSCETSGDINESADVTITSDFVCLPKSYRCSVPMTWADYKTVRDHPKQAVAVSTSDSDYLPMFIENMDYHIVSGNAEFTLILGSETPL